MAEAPRVNLITSRAQREWVRAMAVKAALASAERTLAVDAAWSGTEDNGGMNEIADFIAARYDELQAAFIEWAGKRKTAAATTPLSYRFGQIDTVAEILNPPDKWLHSLVGYQLDAAMWLAGDLDAKRKQLAEILKLREVRVDEDIYFFERRADRMLAIAAAPFSAHPAYKAEWAIEP